MPTQNAEPRLILFPARNREELADHVRREYGDPISGVLERTGTKRLSVTEQNNAVSQLKDAGLNGNASALLDAYRLHLAELSKKEIVQDRWYNKLGRGVKKGATVVKDIALAPFRAIGWAFKNHPFLTTGAIAGLLGYLAYAYGIPLAQFAGEGGAERMEGIAETMRRAVRVTPAGRTPGAGEVPVFPSPYPEIRPPTVQLPER